MTLEVGVPFANHKPSSSVLSAYLSRCLSHAISETLAEDARDKERGRIEDTLQEIMAMNIFWRSSRTVVLCKSGSEIHFASG